MAVHSQNNTLLAEYRYDAWGNQTVTSDTGFAHNPIRYCGEYYDEESGLIYLRNRYYDSAIGRFITEDPIRDGLNWYAYCNGNPILLIDPTGLIGILPDGSIYMDENDTETDRILLQLKIDYTNATSDEERKAIADEAERIRNTTTESYVVMPWHTLELYVIPDLTDEMNTIMSDNEEDFKNNSRDYIWFKNHVETDSLIDVKNSNDKFFRPEYSYHIIYGEQVMRADAPGNIMYGYLGKVSGFTDSELLYGAGAYQIYEDCGGDLLKTVANGYRLFDNYGDNEGDPEQIKMGIGVYNVKYERDD